MKATKGEFMINSPKYLVQVGSTLHAYWREDILQCDLAQGGYDALFKLKQGLTVSYEPIAIQQIGREEYLLALGGRKWLPSP